MAYTEMYSEFFAGCMESFVWTKTHSTFDRFKLSQQLREEVKNGDANVLLIRVAISSAMYKDASIRK